MQQQNNFEADMLKLFNKEKWQRLAACVAIDLVGNLTFLLPAVGEGADMALAPLTGIVLTALFVKYGKLQGFGAGLAGTIEELLPFTDFIPSATIMWFITYIVSKKSTLKKFTKALEKDNNPAGV